MRVRGSGCMSSGASIPTRSSLRRSSRPSSARLQITVTPAAGSPILLPPLPTLDDSGKESSYHGKVDVAKLQSSLSCRPLTWALKSTILYFRPRAKLQNAEKIAAGR